jgi:hypothetical protein
MNIKIATIFICFWSIVSFSQSKKEQLENLNFSLDSCKTIISVQLNQIDTQNKIIDSNSVIILNQAEELKNDRIIIFELEQKLTQERKITKQNFDQITLLKKEIDSLKSTIPVNAFFEYKIIKLVDNQDGRFGSDTEVKLNLIIQNQLVDTYSEFGIPELNSTKNEIFLTSEMSEKTYEIKPISATSIILKYHFFCSDCETQEKEFEKGYIKDDNGVWRYHSCIGDCEEL